MKRILISATAALLVVVSSLVTGCNISFSSNKPGATETPPFEFVSARTISGNGVIVLYLSSYTNGFTSEEIDSFKTDLRNQYPEFTYKPSPGTPVLVDPGVPSVNPSEGVKVVAFGYALYNDRPTATYTGGTSGSAGLEPIYASAQKWFFEELGKSNGAVRMPGWSPG